MPSTVSIVEDNLMCQMVLKNIVENCSDFILKKIYSSAEAAMEIIKNPSDIAIVDIELPGMSGVELIKLFKSTIVNIRCLIYSMHDDDDIIVQALENGADGYILKKSSPEQVRSAMQELKTGGSPLSPYITQRVISFFRKPTENEDALLLSKRETEVIQLIGAGLSYKEIADKLFVSYETVKQHLKNIYIKLNVQNKVEALNKLNQVFFRNRRKTA